MATSDRQLSTQQNDIVARYEIKLKQASRRARRKLWLAMVEEIENTWTKYKQDYNS